MPSDASNSRGWALPMSWTNIRRRFPPRSPQAYGFAAFCIALAIGSRWLLAFLSNELPPFATLYPAVLFAALIGGLGPGIFAAASGAIMAWFIFIPPHFALFPINGGYQVSLLAYCIAAGLIVWSADHFRRVAQRLEEEEHFRKLAVQELSHRLKNKIATIQAIISIQLNGHPELRNNILGRLRALAATDQLIESAQGAGAVIHDIVRAELGPYDTTKLSVHGPEVRLPPKIAITMALLLHELATNAAKYGALSVPSGHIIVSWSLTEADRLNVEWIETNGPRVSPPTRRGFGMRLMPLALGQFDGTCETIFAPMGLICKMTLVLSERDPAPPAEESNSSTLVSSSP